MEEFINNLESEKTEKDARLSNVVALAFVGDSLYCSFIRVKLANAYGKKAGELHKIANKYVNAQSQSVAFNKLMESGFFNEKECAIAKRARNAKLTHIAKHSSIDEYKFATCLEALCGYLFFANEKTRLIELMQKSMAIIETYLKETKCK